MFPGEYAVEVETFELGTISLFAQANKIRRNPNLLSVDVLQDNNGGGVLVYLPAPAFEIPSRAVTVPQSSVVYT